MSENIPDSSKHKNVTVCTTHANPRLQQKERNRELSFLRETGTLFREIKLDGTQDSVRTHPASSKMTTKIKSSVQTGENNFSEERQVPEIQSSGTNIGTRDSDQRHSGWMNASMKATVGAKQKPNLCQWTFMLTTKQPPAHTDAGRKIEL